MYRLKPEEEKIVARARQIAAEEIQPHAERVDAEGVFPAESIQALGRAGYLGLTVPPAHGGMGQGPRVACAVLEVVATRCASTAMVYLMHLCGLSCYNAAPRKIAPQLAAAAQGKHLTTLAFSEQGSRSHFWAPVSQEVRENGHLTLNAKKSWVTSAGHADGYVVSTRAANARSPLESTLYLVLRDDPGLVVSGPWQALGLRGNASAPMTLQGVRLPPERALSEPQKGMEVMLGIVLPWFQLGSAAISVGLSEAAVEATRGHLTTQRFEHLKSALADLPNLRARLAQMRIETDCARAHLVSVIDAVESPGPSTQLLVLEAKAAAAETAIEVTDLGMRACGGAAFSKHLDLERHFRDARAAAVMAPTSDVIHDFIGRALCGMDLFS